MTLFLKVVSELIMKEKLQKCSSSTGSETSEDVGISTLPSSRNTSPEKNHEGGIPSHTNTPNQNTRYLPLNLKIDAPPSPSSSSSRVQTSTSSASSSSLSSEAPTGMSEFKLTPINHFIQLENNYQIM